MKTEDAIARVAEARDKRIAELELELADLKTPRCPKHGIRYNVQLDPSCPQCAIQRA